MHCASCELVVERKLLEEKNIEAVEATTKTGQVRIVYKGDRPSLVKLNKLFKPEGYVFGKKGTKSVKPKWDWLNIIKVVGLATVLIAGFLVLNRSGLSAGKSVDLNSSLLTFLIFGLLAGASSCAALVGGIVLSMTKQWKERYEDKVWQPNLLFNGGRLLAYVVAGLIWGAIGNVLLVSSTLWLILAFGVAGVMIFLGLQMVGLKAAQRWKIAMPKSLTRYVASSAGQKNKYGPAGLGALTVFLPCGFTLTTVGLATASGNPLTGAVMMGLFALGTSPILMAIGIGSGQLLKKPHWSDLFLKTAGLVVIFLGLFNINAQLNVLGLLSFDDISIKATENGLAPMKGGKQIVKMTALAYGYEPNYVKVRAGVPVRWEITDGGVSGCTNAIISKGLFEGEIAIEGTSNVKEFTPENPGKYKFSCWMGMVSGIIEVVDEAGLTGAGSGQIIESGAAGCEGAGGEASCTGGCGGGCGNPSCIYAQ